MDGREVVEEHLVAGALGALGVHGFHLDEGEVPLVFFRRADLTAHHIARSQVEAADLGGGNVDVIRAGEVAVLGGAEKPEAVGQDFEYAFAVAGRGGGRTTQDRRDQLLLSQAGGVLDVQRAGGVHQLGEAE